MAGMVDELYVTCLLTYWLSSLTHSPFCPFTYLPTHPPTHIPTYTNIHHNKQISLDGPKRNTMMLQTQHRDRAKRKTVAFRVPARGKLGVQLVDFLAVCQERVDRAEMPVSEFLGLPFFFLVSV